MVLDSGGRGHGGYGWLGRFLAAGIGALIGRRVLRTIMNAPAERLLRRANYRGAEVSLGGGVACVVGMTAGAVVGSDSVSMASAVAVAGLGSGLVGTYDDVVGSRPDQRSAKGFHGHVSALRRGQVTSGLVKVAGIGAVGLAAATLLAHRHRPSRNIVDIAIDAGVIAGAANLANLLDLRPGRAMKVGMMVSAPLAARRGPAAAVAAGIGGACAALLPDDLAENTMLGDGGANALGAVLGTAIAARSSRWTRAAVLAGIVGLTAASEKVSFTQVIARTPVLRELDDWGRRPS